MIKNSHCFNVLLLQLSSDWINTSHIRLNPVWIQLRTGLTNYSVIFTALTPDSCWPACMDITRHMGSRSFLSLKTDQAVHSPVSCWLRRSCFNASTSVLSVTHDGPRIRSSSKNNKLHSGLNNDNKKSFILRLTVNTIAGKFILIYISLTWVP